MAWTFPLVLQPATHLTGLGVGDNVAFLWNTWWMRHALASADGAFFETRHLFAPFGISLILHTHTALSSFVASTLLASLPLVLAQNAVNLASLALNGFAAYLLAWDRTADRWAAVVAGLVFGGSAFIATHLLGHFNLIGAWVIPLFLLYALRALERRSATASCLAGLFLVAAAYTDYYYLVYCLLLACGFVAARLAALGAGVRRVHARRWLTALLMALLLIDAALVAVILLRGGFDTTLLGVRIVARRPTNLLAIGWGLLAVLLLQRYRPVLSVLPASPSARRGLTRAVAPALLVFLLGASPLISGGWALIQSGGYAAPRPSWRSGPSGVDLATLLLGNPAHPLSGGWTRDVYVGLGVDRMEQSAWFGLVPLLAVLWCLRAHRRHAEVRRWLVVGAVFFVWALGPWLRVGGFDTGLLLPQNFLTLVPLLSNARMPGRAMVLVSLAGAMLTALALSRVDARHRRWAGAAVALLVVIESLPAPFPLTRIDVPPIYTKLRALESGTVCELPLGMRDGFGMTGAFDDRVLAHQMVHEHPIVGGFAARVPDALKAAYRDTPVVRSLFRLSEGQSADPLDAGFTRQQIGAALEEAGIRYVVIDRAAASPELMDYAGRIPMERMEDDGTRALYRVLASDSAVPSLARR